MKININKTKQIVLTKVKEIPLVKLKINNNSVEQVKQFKYQYLESTLTSYGRCSTEIRQRMSMAKKHLCNNGS